MVSRIPDFDVITSKMKQLYFFKTWSQNDGIEFLYYSILFESFLSAMVSFVMVQVKQYKYYVFSLDPFHYLSRCSISKFSCKDNATHKLNFWLQL